jgi:hypothetical protein
MQRNRAPAREGAQRLEKSMSRKAKLREERESIVHWLLSALLGRVAATKEAIDRTIHRLGTVERRLKDEDG